MRNLYTLDRYRDTSTSCLAYYGSIGDETCGAFYVPSPIDGAPMRVVASCGGGWDHVSVSRRNRCPNWIEMEHIKRMFFQPDEVCMQLHVAESEHLSLHEFCLHIWRPQNVPIPLPDPLMVAPPRKAKPEPLPSICGACGNRAEWHGVDSACFQQEASS